jgi:hypothetical protein
MRVISRQPKLRSELTAVNCLNDEHKTNKKEGKIAVENENEFPAIVNVTAHCCFREMALRAVYLVNCDGH